MPSCGSLLCVGTRDGLFLFESDAERRTWRQHGPLLAGCDVGALAVDGRGRILAGTKQHGIFRSDDVGATWNELPLDRRGAELNAYYARYQNPFVQNGTDESSIWAIEVAPDDPDRLYVGVLPAGLFTSPDGGASWSEVSTLRDLPQTQEMWGPFQAPFLHSIVFAENGVGPDANGRTPTTLAVAVSVGGIFRSHDQGQTWAVSNDGMERWKPDGSQYDDVHQDIHRLVISPADRHRLYATVHESAILRSDDGGAFWKKLPLGDEAQATRPIAVHPRNPDRLWIGHWTHPPRTAYPRWGIGCGCWRAATAATRSWTGQPASAMASASSIGTP